jgi:hypothetical protein
VRDVCLLTPTRDRPEAFALCARWLERQTFRGTVQWIVVDDGDAPIDPAVLERARDRTGVKVDYVRREPAPLHNTLPQNLLAGLERVDSDLLVVFEDDEYYSPLYVEEMAWRLRTADITGECKARYYQVQQRRFDHLLLNNRHASLCRTGIRRSCYDGLRRASEDALAVSDPFVDMRLWAMYAPPLKPQPPGPQKPDRPWAVGAQWRAPSGAPRTSIKEYRCPDGIVSKLFEGRGLSVGIKGMPGRGNLGTHGSARQFSNGDPDWDKLVEWCGADAEHYIALAAKYGWKAIA